MTARLRHVLGVTAGVVVGIVVAAMLIALTEPPFDYSVNPQSREGVERALIAAAAALVAGAAIDFLPTALSKAALWTSAAILGTLGLFGIVLSRDYMFFVWGLVMTPALVLGKMLPQRFQRFRPGQLARKRIRPELDSDGRIMTDESRAQPNDEL